MHEVMRAPLLGLLFLACAAPARDIDPIEVPGTRSEAARPAYVLTAVDGAVDEALRRDVDRGIERVEAFFGAPFPAPFEVLVLPDRAAFTDSFPPEWGMPETACWMVAAGVADALRILDPAVWDTDACEHDAGDAQHVAGIVAHELAHVFHGQNNPTGDFVGAEEVGWFGEGLAVLVSGQLETGHRASAVEAVRSGDVPARLAQAWSGPHRYGVSGTLVEYIDRELGRLGLFALLAATTEAEILAALGRDEEDLLAEWALFVEAGAR
jgi:hypothetical protein